MKHEGVIGDSEYASVRESENKNIRKFYIDREDSSFNYAPSRLIDNEREIKKKV